MWYKRIRRRNEAAAEMAAQGTQVGSNGPINRGKESRLPWKYAEKFHSPTSRDLPTELKYVGQPSPGVSCPVIF